VLQLSDFRRLFFPCADYLTNVLDDLGLEPSDTVTTMVSLLQASPELYNEMANKSPQRLASAIATMRCLKLD
jgi:hypothetical protein